MQLAFTPAGVLIAMLFVGFPFVVRTLQPVLESLDRDLEEAAESLGATRWQRFVRVLLPLAVVFTEALRQGLAACLAALAQPDAWAALRLSLAVAAIAVPLNLAFGLATAWTWSCVSCGLPDGAAGVVLTDAAEREQTVIDHPPCRVEPPTHGPVCL